MITTKGKRFEAFFDPSGPNAAMEKRSIKAQLKSEFEEWAVQPELCNICAKEESK
jgi:hypothetical protein